MKKECCTGVDSHTELCSWAYSFKELDLFRTMLTKLCDEISHIGHTRSCSYDSSNGPDGDYCSCNLHLRKGLIVEARKALEAK